MTSNNTPQRGAHVYRVFYPGQKPFDVRADGLMRTPDRVELFLNPVPGSDNPREVTVLWAPWSSGICIVRPEAVITKES